MKSLLKKITALPTLPLAVVLFGILFLLLPSVAYAGWEDYVFAPLEWAWGAVSKGLVYIIVAPIAEALASFFGYLLIFSSTIFEVMLNTTVIGFGTTLTTYGILDGIRLVWSAFRDIANIVIIGMFVFVAISMILGNMTYGTKKFVAKILTVAVLINFSLLFTQLVVDTSHIAASQFYRGIRAAAVNNSPAFQEVEQSGGEQAFDTAWNKQGGVAGAFINNMGISGFGDTYKLVAKAGTQEGLAVAVFYSLTMIAILIATSAVFLYGAYLLTARAILLIVLLATAALAFASWIVPKYGEGKYGWDGWLTTLIQTSVFAPLLMILLWASIVILSQVGKVRTGSMGSFLQNPTSDTSASSAIVVYLFTLGMLFLSFKIASSFSHKITGFSIATAALNIGGRFAGGAIGYTGRFGVRQFEKTGLAKKMVSEHKLWGAAGLGESRGIEKAIAQFGSKALSTATKASLNPARIPAALSDKYKKLEEQYGWKTQGKGGIVEADKRAEKVREEGLKELGAQIQRAGKTDPKEAKRIFEQALKAESSSRNQAVEKQTETLQRLEQAHKEVASQLADAERQAQGKPIISPEVAKAQDLKRRLGETTEQIADAQKAAADAALKAKDVEDMRTTAFEKAKSEIIEITKTAEKQIIESKYPGDDGWYDRQKAHEFFDKQRKDKKQRETITGALADLGTKEGGVDAKPGPKFSDDGKK